jgi:hypothetical protein
MLGEFHPTNLSPGLRNAAFRPLRSSTPLLVIRHMVESDIDFLTRSLDPPQIRIQSLKAYLQFLGSSLSIASKTKAEQALAEASQVLGQELKALPFPGRIQLAKSANRNIVPCEYQSSNSLQRPVAR